MSKLREITLVVFSAALLPGVVCIYVSLGLVQLNLEEIRSLPNTYTWITGAFLTLWLVNVVCMLVASRGIAEWPARTLILIAASIFVFDFGRAFWLSAGWQVAVVGLIEIIVVCLLAVTIWRTPMRKALEYAQFFALALISVTVLFHVHAVGPRLLWNVLKEINRPSPSTVQLHPNPWHELAITGTAHLETVDAARVQPASGDVDIDLGSAIRISNASDPGAQIATLRVPMPPGGDRLIAKLDLNLLAGDVAVGIKNPTTGQWIYRQQAARSDGSQQTLVIPLHSDRDFVELEFANGSVGQSSFSFEILSASVHSVTNVFDAVPAGSAGNVYHVLLDAFEIARFQEVTAERPDLFYDDFTLYDQFRTSQPSTEWSLPTIFAGSYYDTSTGLDGNTWREQAYQAGFLAELSQSSIPTYQYTWFSAQCYDDATFCQSSQDYRHDLLSQVSDNFVLDLTVLRVIPNSVRAVLIGSVGKERRPADSWDYGFSLSAKFGNQNASTEVDHILKDFYFSLNLFTIDFFKKMLVEEAQRPATGQYVFFHAMVPHSPYARDRRCEFIPPEQRTRDNLRQRNQDQAMCALQLVGWLVEQLKLLGKYEDALIIVHSDHGAFRPPPDAASTRLDQFESDEWPHWAVDSLSAGLLMIKWPQASGTATSRSSAPAQTADIAPTILEHFGVHPPAHYGGTSLKSMPDDFQRQMVFYAVKRPTIGTSVDHLSRYVRDGRNEWRFERNVPTKP